MKQAIFFDLDGTLWDAIEEIKDSYNEAMKTNNLKYRFDYKTIKSFMGLTPLETVKLAFTDVDEKEGLRYFDMCIKHIIKYLATHPGKLYPYEIETLGLLSKSYLLYIVSNADKGYIENYLNNYDNNHYFSGHLCAGDTSLDKADNIRLLMKKAGIDEVIYVGDTLKDLKECEKANVDFIHASYGFGVIDDPKYKINSLKELPNVVNKIFNK